jgi:hypothetical protein
MEKTQGDGSSVLLITTQSAITLRLMNRLKRISICMKGYLLVDSLLFYANI